MTKTSTLFMTLFLSAHAYADNSLSLTLADPLWDGKKIPAGQQCHKFNGQGSSPALAVKQIPAEANAIVMEYSDRSFPAMDLGGHGKFAYRIKHHNGSASIPSVPGHTFELPEGFFLIEAQRAPTWDKAGAYLPPCSGGNGNDYYLTIKAVVEQHGGIREVLATTEVFLGKY